MSKLEDDPAAKELKKLMCAGCYQSLIGWINGTSSIPFVPCAACAVTSKQWLEERWSKRRS